MKTNLFMFFAGVLTCLSVISVSGFVASPTKPANKPAAVVSAPQTPKQSECDCVELRILSVFWGNSLNGMFLDRFIQDYNRLMKEKSQAVKEKKCIILRPDR